MTPELSRRLAWFMNVVPMPPKLRLNFLSQVADANTFEDLPKELQHYIAAVEAEKGFKRT
jgi:hypothetical protein